MGTSGRDRQSPMMKQAQRLDDVFPELERIFRRVGESPILFAVSEIRCDSLMIKARDGISLATDIYLPPVVPGPVMVMRTPYGRANDQIAGMMLSVARRGYVVVSQDCRGTGGSQPDSWDYYMYETEDSWDLIEWIVGQGWYGGFIGSCGGSYTGQTQWCMGVNPRMSAIVPEVSGLGLAVNTAHLYMFIDSYARSVGKGSGKKAIHYTEMERAMAAETMAGGYFNEPLHREFPQALLNDHPQLETMEPAEAKRWLWQSYCSLSSAQRAAFVRKVFSVDAVSAREVEALGSIFGHRVSHDAHSLPYADATELCRQQNAPALMVTGWYDWGLNDALETWRLLRHEAKEELRKSYRLIVTPSAHNALGYHEGIESHPELQHNHRTINHVDLLLCWYASVRGGTTEFWPTVIYYLMGANQWMVSSEWPPTECQRLSLYLHPRSTLSRLACDELSEPDSYTYDPDDPTPTVGGSIVSYMLPPGSVDVSEVHERADILVYVSAPLKHDLDVVGPMTLILYVSSSAVDTDFSARLSDVFADGRAIQLQSGLLRARYRNLSGEPEFLVPGEIYRLEIDMWATANRFKAGHRICVDISSADFPRFDRNTNRGGEDGPPVRAVQTIYHDREHPSHIQLYCLPNGFESL